MISVYCDRCKKKIPKDTIMYPYEKSKVLPEGAYFATIMIAHPNGDESEYENLDLCPACEQDLADNIAAFMKEKCKRKK